MAYIESGDAVEQKHFDFLEKLRQSGKTNMILATSHLQDAYPGDFPRGDAGYDAAGKVLLKWIRRHRLLKRGRN